jgi:hypothetical protein
MTKHLTEYDYEVIPPERTITISFDIDPSEVELALATNAASLRQASLLALLAALSSTIGTLDQASGGSSLASGEPPTRLES